MAMVTSERTIRFQFGSSINDQTFKIVQAFCRFIVKDNHFLLEEVVPGYHTVTVFYKKEVDNTKLLIEDIIEKWTSTELTESTSAYRSIKIPVCYDEKFSDDMNRIMNHTGLSRSKVISLHTERQYTVYMIGFLPGFPYLGELDEALRVPRLEIPRLKVPKGAVGIGSNQTGIYSLESPGGWNILGRTPIDLYCPYRAESFLLQAGDRVSFYPISLDDYNNIQNSEDINLHQIYSSQREVR